MRCDANFTHFIYNIILYNEVDKIMSGIPSISPALLQVAESTVALPRKKRSQELTPEEKQMRAQIRKLHNRLSAKESRVRKKEQHEKEIEIMATLKERITALEEENTLQREVLRQKDAYILELQQKCAEFEHAQIAVTSYTSSMAVLWEDNLSYHPHPSPKSADIHSEPPSPLRFTP